MSYLMFNSSYPCRRFRSLYVFISAYIFSHAALYSVRSRCNVEFIFAFCDTIYCSTFFAIEISLSLRNIIYDIQCIMSKSIKCNVLCKCALRIFKSSKLMSVSLIGWIILVADYPHRNFAVSLFSVQHNSQPLTLSHWFIAVLDASINIYPDEAFANYSSNTRRRSSYISCELRVSLHLYTHARAYTGCPGKCLT